MPKKVIIIILLFIFVGFFGRLIVGGIKWSPVLFQYFFQKDIVLKKTESRINILFLGIGGGTHDGPLLTDTIIYASVNPASQKVTMVSIPRDLWISDLQEKINYAYAFGENKKKGGGLMLVKVAVEKIFNQPVDYAVRVDFNGFTKAIDLIGGIDVNIQNNFEDSEYPISGKENDVCGFTGDEFEKRATLSATIEAFPCRYEKISFKRGVEHMDGARALKFVRSRHATGSEGSDFARSRRQEAVIEAFKNKILSLNILLNPGKLMGLYDVFRDSVDTDIKQDEYDDFIKLAMKFKNTKINNVVFSYSDSYAKKQEIFINPVSSLEFDNQWVLIPRAGNNNFSEVQRYVKCEIEVGNCSL